MKNKNLIDNLSKDLTPWKSMDSLSVFTIKWIGISFILFIINYIWMPLRLDLSLVMKETLFHVENVLWIILAFSSSFALYKSSLPDSVDKKFANISVVTFLVLLVFSLSGNTVSMTDLPHELDLWRGRCGFIIAFFSVLQTPALALWAKKGAPSKPGITGVWASLSSASVGCLLMQFICNHQSSAHLLMWHFIPLSLMCVLSYFIATKILRW